jgi:hypothetical protein
MGRGWDRGGKAFLRFGESKTRDGQIRRERLGAYIFLGRALLGVYTYWVVILGHLTPYSKGSRGVGRGRKDLGRMV